jgi:hypothetical protein
MSLLPYTVFAGIAIGATSVPIEVRDVQYETVAGVDREVPIRTRTIDAAVDSSDKRRMEFIFGGSTSDNDIAIWPLAECDALHFVDNFRLPAFAEEDVRRQSFVTYGGIEYRVVADADFTLQAGRHVYLASRHVAQELPQ